MKVLVLGANGATGFNVVSLLLKEGFFVKAMTRNLDKFNPIANNKSLEIIKAGILDISDQKLKDILADTDAVISCLGHNISLKGIFGKPHFLVTDALKRIFNSITGNNNCKAKKIILMNTTACLNLNQNEKFVGKENLVMTLMRNILPPQKDNEQALSFLMNLNPDSLEWVAVRPDSLINNTVVSEYTVHTSHLRSPVFNAGKTSRINVADFMVSLLKSGEQWEKWKFKTPVIYNK